jgi:hypothetical protein
MGLEGATMEDIQQQLDLWQQGEYINPDALEAAHKAITLLVAKVDQLQQQVDTLVG